jgi:iron-sulfur cluster assembly protein
MASLVANAMRRKAAFSVTETAANRIKEILSKKPTALGIKVGVRTRGCNGMSYTMNYVEKPNKLDDVVSEHGVTVYIDNKSLFYLVGTSMDFVTSDTASEFVFNNPNAKSKCGCGESFNV